jgi:hypothetical protein
MTMTGASARTGAKDTLARVLDGRQMLVSTSPRRARRIAALVVVAGFGLLVAMVARNHEVADWSPSGRLVWSLSLLAAVVLAARGIYLGRPVTSMHAGAALTMLAAGIGAHLLGVGVSGDLLVAGAGFALMWPLPSRPGPDGPESVRPLIEATRAIRLRRLRCSPRRVSFPTAMAAPRSLTAHCWVSLWSVEIRSDSLASIGRSSGTSRRCVNGAAGGSWCSAADSAA